jgi:hypothetical protein
MERTVVEPSIRPHKGKGREMNERAWRGGGRLEWRRGRGCRSGREGII